MDPPVTAMATPSSSSLHEPQALPSTAAASSFSLIDQLLFFDAFGDDAAAAALPFTPLGATLSSASIPAHDALMAFLAEMDALDRDNDDDGQESVTSSMTYSSDTETASASASTTTSEISTATEKDGTHGDPDDEVAVVAGKDQPIQIEAQSAEPRPTITATATATAANPVKKKKRIRAKHEIDMLREDTVALQRRLEMLQSNATNKQKREAEDAGKQEDSAIKRKKTKLRHAGAVEQNRQLRKMVKTQLRYAKQIENLLTSQSNDEEDRNIFISDNAITHVPLSKADLVVFYEAMTGKLDTLYTQLDDAFADMDPKGASDFNDVKLVVDDDKHATLQLRDVRTLPFGFESVKDVTWRILKAQSVKEGDGADELLVADEDVMLMRRGLKVQLEKGAPEVEIPMRAVSKRFLSKDRMVFCWDGTTDWPAPPQASKDQQSISLREKGWAVIKPVPGNPGLSSMQMCLLMTPGVSDKRMLAMATKEEIEEGITKTVVPTYQQLFVSRYQMVENMLLDEQKR